MGCVHLGRGRSWASFHGTQFHGTLSAPVHVCVRLCLCLGAFDYTMVSAIIAGGNTSPRGGEEPRFSWLVCLPGAES